MKKKLKMNSLQFNGKHLSKKEIEHFMRDGYLVVHRVFSRKIADQIIPLVCAELKININDPSTWPKHLVTLQKLLDKRENILPSNWFKFTPVVVLRKTVENELFDKIYTKRYNEVIDDLCKIGRWKQKTGIGHWPILFPLFKGQSWQPLEDGWHIDGDFERLSISSGNRGLILIHLFTDIPQGGGGTAVRISSHHYTARILAEAGSEGLERDILIRRLTEATQHLPVKEITGKKGDLILMHPWTVHRSSFNTSGQFRITANKHIDLYAPMNFKRKNRSDFSPIEFAVINSIQEPISNSSLETNNSNKTSKGINKRWSIVLVAKKLRRFKVKDFVRILVLRSNKYWPFSILNKQPYYFAIKKFIKYCSQYPEIKSVYLRHPLAEGNWTPALSDIDLTVITKKDITIEQEFDFLDSFWKNFKRIKKLFPMYGEVYVLNEEEFELCQKIESEGHNWSLLSGVNIIKNFKPQSNNQFNFNGFDHALNFYLNQFRDLFNYKSFSSHLVLFDLVRLKNKISKCLNGSHSNRKPTNSLIPGPDILLKRGILSNIIEKLSDYLKINIPAPSDVSNQWRLQAEERNYLSVDEEVTEITNLLHMQDQIQCIYINFNRLMFVILKDELDQQELRNCIDVIAETFSNKKRLPIILNVSLFRYFLRQYKPFEYGHFISYRVLALGKDILPEIEPPDKSSFVRHLIKEVTEIINFPLCQNFFSSSNKWYSRSEFEYILNMALLLKYYLEKDSILLWYYDLLKECYDAYPEYVEKIEELHTRSKKSNDKALRFQWFILFKQLAKDIQKSMCVKNNSGEILKDSD